MNGALFHLLLDIEALRFGRPDQPEPALVPRRITALLVAFVGIHLSGHSLHQHNH
jgi:hypothetical protein